MGREPGFGLLRLEMHSGQLQIGTASIYYEMIGEGPPVALLHGFAVDLRMWDDQVDALASRYQVVRYDLRGFGRSTPGSDAFSHADDLHALLTHLGLERAAVIGLSMGGGAVINFAIAYPDAVRALIAVDPSLGGHVWSSEFAASQAAIRADANERGIAAAREAWLTLPIFTPILAVPGAGERVRQLIGDYSGFHWVNKDLGRSLKPPAIQRLDEIRAPTLIIVGERDTADFHQIAATLERGIPNARTLVIPGAGHMPNMEHPRRFNDVVMEFLRSIRT
jgi:pimeloyl-ACP methyl ester carboxylesterase